MAKLLECPSTFYSFRGFWCNSRFLARHVFRHHLFDLSAGPLIRLTIFPIELIGFPSGITGYPIELTGFPIGLTSCPIGLTAFPIQFVLQDRAHW